MSLSTRIASALLLVPLLVSAPGLFAPDVAEAAGVPGVRIDLLIDGRLAREYYANERIYVEAKKGREYAVRLSNDTPERVAVALAVDGLNTIDASHTRAKEAPKWVLGPYATITVSGWQVSTSHNRKFVFTSEEKSYGAWVGDTRNLGLVSAVVYGERTVCCREPVPYSGRYDDRDMDWDMEEAPTRSKRRSRKGKANRQAGAQKPSPSADSAGASSRAYEPAPRKEAEERAATGSGRRTKNEVVWTDFELNPNPLGSVDIRYGFRTELVELGVLPAPRPRRSLDRREAARGFAPDPGGRCCR